MYCRVYLRQKFYNLNCILMTTCIFVETSIPMFPTLSLFLFKLLMSDNNIWNNNNNNNNNNHNDNSCSRPNNNNNNNNINNINNNNNL